jgi:hypothetical protein
MATRGLIDNENEDDNDLSRPENIAYGANRQAGSLCYFTPPHLTMGPREAVSSGPRACA